MDIQTETTAARIMNGVHLNDSQSVFNALCRAIEAGRKFEREIIDALDVAEHDKNEDPDIPNRRGIRLLNSIDDVRRIAESEDRLAAFFMSEDAA